MKRSEMLAWIGLAGLLAIGIVLLVGGILYNTTTFWAGMMLAFGQSLVVGLAAWGLLLARQQAELEEIAPPSSAAPSFRMSFDTAGVTAAREQQPEIKTLDTGFQRLVAGLAALLLLGLAAGIGWMIYRTFSWARLHADLPFPIAGSFDKPHSLDELALVIGLASASAYFGLYYISRLRREMIGTGEAVNSNFTLGLAGMLALGLATVLGYLKVAYAAEIAASVISALLALQGLELLLNSLRSYSAVEELDQEAVDLQALPLVPMLASVWLNDVKMLFAQSVGLSRTRQKSVLGRLMPRTLAATLLIAILVSCFRVVRPGEVAVLERFGYAPQESGKDGFPQLASSAILHPGLHLTLPWPIDTLVMIPTTQLQITNVGAELHAPKGGGKVDFQFWTVRDVDITSTEENEDQFATGDPGSPQLLETFVVVTWRVRQPASFYLALSHSNAFEREKGREETRAVPIYTALVQQCASFAVTRTFAIHSLDQIMTVGRGEVESHCKGILQSKLNEARSGIEVVDLVIRDLHPPFGKGRATDATDPRQWPLGPAHAYENVISQREFRDQRKNDGEAAKIGMINRAKGEYDAEINKALTYKLDKIAKAQGEAARMVATMADTASTDSHDQPFMLNLAQRQAMYRSLKDAFDQPVNKIVVDPQVKNVDLYQTTDKSPGAPRPPGS